MRRDVPTGAAALFTIALLATSVLAACSTGTPTVATPRTSLRPVHALSHALRTPTPTVATSSAAPTGPSSDDVSRARREIARIAAPLGRGGVSVAVLDTTTGTSFSAGATHGMLCASVAKLFILETLLLRHQHTHPGRPLGDGDRDLATAMIERSDNDAANDLYERIGEAPGLRRAAGKLGVTHTTYGTGDYWGYTRTSGNGYLPLLSDLVATGPLTAASRRFALHLLAHVEDDQRWGVGSVADRHRTFYNKNGWLAVTVDHNRWAVNSVGIVTHHHDRLLMVVLTQHGSSFRGGIGRVEKLAHVAASVVTTR